MKKNILSLTMVINATSNYGQGLGNTATVHKVNRNSQSYGFRSKESMKQSILEQAGFYDDLTTIVDGATQKFVSEDVNAALNRASEGGYMCTATKKTYKRISTITLSDAISCDYMRDSIRFHTNLGMAENYAKANGINIQEKLTEEESTDEKGKKKEKAAGLMPYTYEFDKGLKVYSINIDLDRIGEDENFPDIHASKEEKISRVVDLLRAVQSLNLSVKGSVDNASPIFAVGGISNRFSECELAVVVRNNNLVLSNELESKVNKFGSGFIEGILDNTDEVNEQLKPVAMDTFFDNLVNKVEAFFA